MEGEGDKKICYITFKHSDQAQAAIDNLNDKLFLSQTTLKVEKHESHHSIVSSGSMSSTGSGNNVNSTSSATTSSGSSSNSASASGGSTPGNSSASATVNSKTIVDEDLDEYSLRATRTLYIGNLDRDVKHCDLREKLDKKYGDIVEIEIKKVLVLKVFY